jgi:hypothetical protein
MSILSKSELKEHSSTMLKARRDFSERFSGTAKSSVFLSHKHSDKTEVRFARDLLNGLGADAYVDWLDPDLPEKTRGETAVIIKQKIKSNDKFILLATEAALESQWCNWELGYGDANKHADSNLALFPLREDNSSWRGNEYMQLYHTIEYENGTNEYKNGRIIPAGYYICSPFTGVLRTIIPLKDWLVS